MGLENLERKKGEAEVLGRQMKDQTLHKWAGMGRLLLGKSAEHPGHGAEELDQLPILASYLIRKGEQEGEDLFGRWMKRGNELLTEEGALTPLQIRMRDLDRE